MDRGFKGVPAVIKCFKILEFFATSTKELGISEISKTLGYHKSTVFNIVHTLVQLGVLENISNNKFDFGTKLYALGKANGQKSKLIHLIHPYLEKINQKTQLSTFLGMRSGMKAVIIDKVDSAYDIKISSDIGIQLPLLVAASGRALLSQMQDHEIDKILKENSLKKFTNKSCVNKKRYKELIAKTRKEGIGLDKEEYIEGISAISIPLNIRKDLQIAIWAVGLKKQISHSTIPGYKKMLLEVKKEIEFKFMN